VRTIRHQQLSSSFNQLHQAAARLVETLPSSDQFPLPTAAAIQALTDAIMPTLTLEKGWRDAINPTHHSLFTGELETLNEAAQQYREGFEQLREIEGNTTAIDFLDPGLVPISGSYALKVSLLLRELEERVRPGQIIEGPIQASDDYRQILDQIAQDLRRRSGSDTTRHEYLDMAGQIYDSAVEGTEEDDSPPANPSDAERIETDQLVPRYQRLHQAAARLLVTLPPTSQLPVDTASELAAVSAAILPAAQHAGLDPARHSLAIRSAEAGSGGQRPHHPRTLAEAGHDGRQTIEAGWKAEASAPHESLLLHQPEFTAISVQRARITAELLTELAERLRPGRTVDGPILGNDSYRRFVAEIAQDLYYRSGGGAGPRSWDHDPEYWDWAATSAESF